MEQSFLIQGTVLTSYHGREERVQVPYGIKEIGPSCFKDNRFIKYVTLPDTVTVIGPSAFAGCSYLEEINLSDNLLTIEEYGFVRCTALRSIELPEGLLSIQKFAFRGCINLSHVKLPSTIQRLERQAFSNCKYLATSQISLPDKAYVDPSAFHGCCVYGYRIIQGRLHCDNEGYEIDEMIELELKDNEDIGDAIVDIYEEHLLEWYQDIIDSALEQYVVVPQRYFEVESVENGIHQAANEYITKILPEISIVFDVIDNAGTVFQSCPIDLTRILQNTIDQRFLSESSICAAADYIETALDLFVKSSRWHFGLSNGRMTLEAQAEWPLPTYDDGHYVWKVGDEVLKPTMWFGLENKHYLDGWGVNTFEDEDEEDELSSFWCSDDDWSIMNHLTDGEEYFLTWYLGELGKDAPPIADIKGCCPVQWDKNDSCEDLERKISEYMVNLRNQSHSL